MKRFIALIVVLFIAMFPVDLYAKSVSESSVVAALTGRVDEVRHSINGGRDEVLICLNAYSGYKAMYLANPDRLVIDISGVEAPGKQQIMYVGSSIISTIRYAQFDKGIARVVLDVNKRTEYSIQKDQKGLRVLLYGGQEGKTEKEAGESPGEAASPDSGTDLADRGSVIEKKKITINKNFYLEYVLRKDSIEISLHPGRNKKYNVMRLTGPDRIVVDISGLKLQSKEKQLSINKGIVKSIRYAQFGKNTGRIVLDMNGQPEYEIDEKKDRLVLSIKNSSYENLTYRNNGDRIYFTLDKALLTNGVDASTKFYTAEYDSSGKKYTITFPRNLANLKDATLHINDGLLEWVSIKNDAGKNTTSIVLSSPKQLSYVVFGRQGLGNTTITVIEPASKSDKLVVIDAGHGGTQPGAVYGDIKEKDLNLDIAKRLNSLLIKKKVKTYMIRDDDSDVELYERAYIANALNASLFISIHNNAMGDTSYGGTMTLYYPQSLNSRSFNGGTFAQIVHKSLISKLGTTDRKMVQRPNLVVLKATRMPSALAEIAFITNAADRNNLMKSSFRQKAAQALCDAIVEALKKVR